MKLSDKLKDIYVKLVVLAFLVLGLYSIAAIFWYDPYLGISHFWDGFLGRPSQGDGTL